LIEFFAIFVKKVFALPVVVVSASKLYNKLILLYNSPANQIKSRTQDLLSGFLQSEYETQMETEK